MRPYFSSKHAAGGLFAAAAVLAAGLAFTMPAQAQSPCGAGTNTGNSSNDGACAQVGTYAVGATLALDSDLSNFGIGAGNNNVNATVGSGNVFVQSTDGAGYNVQLTSTNWIAGANSFPASDLSAYTWSNGGKNQASGPLSTAAQTFAECAAVSGTGCGQPAAPDVPASGGPWDTWPVNGYWLNTVPAVPSGNYQATIMYSLWGN